MLDMEWVVGFVLGAALLLATEAYVFYRLWLQPRLRFKYPALIRPPQLVKSKWETTSIVGGDAMLKKERTEWLNALLMRLWYENHQKPWLADTLRRKLLEELVDVKRTTAGVFLKEYGVQDVFIGNYPPKFDNYTVMCTQQLGSSVAILFDVAYTGDLCAIINLTLSVLDIPLSIFIRVKEITGRMIVQYQEDPKETIAFGFVQMPNLNLEVNCRFAGEINPVLNTLILWQVRRIVKKKFTLPYLKYKWIFNKPRQPPYPWEVENETQMYEWEDEPRTLPRTTSSSSISSSIISPELGADNGAGSQDSPSLPPSPPDSGRFSESRRSVQPNDTASPKMAKTENHAWHVFTYPPNSKCDLCNNPLWGAARQGVRCSNCGLAAHEKCKALAAQGGCTVTPSPAT